MEKVFEKIEAYFEGTMNETESLAFEKELDNDTTLASIMDRHQMANDALEVLIEDNLRSELKAMAGDEKIKPIATRQKGIRRYLAPLAIAASVVLLVGFFSVIQMNAHSNESILNRHYTAYEMPMVRSGGSTQPLTEGVKAYQAKDYEAAINYFGNIPIEAPLYTKAQFYLGQAFYQNQQYEQALMPFGEIANSDDLELNEKADWYALLAGLAAKQENTTDFKNRLNRIATDKDHSFQNQAQTIQQDLESFWR